MMSEQPRHRAHRTEAVREFLHNLPLPPAQVAGIIAVVLLDAVGTARLPGSRPIHRVVGSTLLVAGCSVVGWALAERRRYDRARFDLDRPQSLVTTGPYAFSRHPMYLGWWLIHLGAGVLRGSSWVVLTAPAAVLAEHRGVLTEERQLADSFGRTFGRYAERVPRYVGIPVSRDRTDPESADPISADPKSADPK